jgi:signal transduction histidine kinase
MSEKSCASQSWLHVSADVCDGAYAAPQYVAAELATPTANHESLDMVNGALRDASHEALSVVTAALRDTQARLLKSYAALTVAQDAASSRERFIAVLVHDLRNSLQSIAFGTEHLRQNMTDQRSLGVVERIERSSDRMTELVQNVLDLVRGRLSGGIPLALKRADGLAAELRHVIAEVQSAHVRTRIEVALALAVPVVCDRHRLAQLLGNLLSNAITHGAPDASIQVRIIGSEKELEISVSNAGVTIPAERLSNLFEAFSHGPDSLHQGLGLGLYIATGIANAHGGVLSVLSADGRTCFTFRMPCAKPHNSLA